MQHILHYIFCKRANSFLLGPLQQGNNTVQNNGIQCSTNYFINLRGNLFVAACYRPNAAVCRKIQLHVNNKAKWGKKLNMKSSL